jgi:hypothetical protein
MGSKSCFRLRFLPGGLPGRRVELYGSERKTEMLKTLKSSRQSLAVVS